MRRDFGSPGWLFLAAGLCLPAAASAQAAKPANAIQLPADTPTIVSGVKAACTGIGESTRANPQWKAFAVKIEAAAPGGDYLGGETLDIASDRGVQVLAVTCNSPWVLLDLKPGGYKVTAWSGRRGPKTVMIHAPAKGQARYVLDFSKPG